jgi:superfamily II DNA or RNA helicase
MMVLRPYQERAVGGLRAKIAAFLAHRKELIDQSFDKLTRSASTPA